MATSNQLESLLLQLDDRSYKSYRDIKGSYQFPDFTLVIDRVQGDPFASPSQVRVYLPQSVAGFPSELYRTDSRAIALEDYLTRSFDWVAGEMSCRRGTGNSGLIAITRVGQSVLERTSALVSDEGVEIRFVVGLPARGRRISGRQAAEMLCQDIPDIIEQSIKYEVLDPAAIKHHVETVEDADWLRQQLASHELVAFIPNGAILPRSSGVDDKPLQEDAIAFQSPKTLEVAFTCPNRGLITGMGIPEGITLIVGGGYHGKSTMLKAIELGVYNHIPGDGRELVVTNPTAVKIRAEDGRGISGVDISPFINQLPHGRSTEKFSTTNASGSTSQAANIIEALEAGTKLLLVDEDTAATNFMIRDRRMQELIAKDKEPITPFIDKVKQLYTEYGVSTILVMGGSGDYFDVADTVIAMDNFQPQDVTEKAQLIAEKYFTERTAEGGKHFGTITPRVPLADGIDPSRGRKAVKLKVRDVDEVGFGAENIDLSAVEQIVEVGQLRAISRALVYAKEKYIDERLTLSEILALVMKDIEEEGLDVLTFFPEGDLVQFRRLELAAALNRLRTLSVL
ncbi:MAG: ABC-ATPase domain-containing protein [Moorea sp. SIOASIH]|uniref:ABC-ATPase domain-containing protein n=1 Tax=Moorena sp. SIOASIH TaxID=2607817 RepID=UPI0013BB30FF|nr:ABC-ATPase domain-containing protein [Moorena sp. SIOASIH]NEO36916.1 ABC-ATPase domain-containing protein [Moorena sp. SIOASIH]